MLLFDACWLLATARLGHAEPDEKQIAEAFVDADLFEDADVGDVPRDADSVLRYRDWIEQERAKAWAAVPSEPQAEATEAPSPSPPPGKRGRSRRP